MNGNRICYVDNKKYSYCPRCAADRWRPSWSTMFCCERCMTVFTTLEDYYFGKITKEKAKGIISMQDLSDKKNFTPEIQKQIEEIMREDAPIIEKVEVSDRVEEIKNDTEIQEQKPKKKFQKKKKRQIMK